VNCERERFMKFSRSHSDRILLVPNQWNGSVEHYYHFLLGYLMPAWLEIQRKNLNFVTVRDCGPMNRWFEPLATRVDLEIMNVGHVLHVFAGKLQRSVVLPASDDPSRFDPHEIRGFALGYLDAAEIAAAELPVSGVTIVDRCSSDPFYNSSQSEALESGAERRSVPNLAELPALLGSVGHCEILDAAEVQVESQLKSFTRTSTIVGQHGAGLANMIWMPRGGRVIEILPPTPSHAVEIFRNLARACGHEYVVINQESAHAEVDLELLASTIKQ